MLLLARRLHYKAAQTEGGMFAYPRIIIAQQMQKFVQELSLQGSKSVSELVDCAQLVNQKVRKNFLFLIEPFAGKVLCQIQRSRQNSLSYRIYGQLNDIVFHILSKLRLLSTSLTHVAEQVEKEFKKLLFTLKPIITFCRYGTINLVKFIIKCILCYLLSLSQEVSIRALSFSLKASFPV